MTHYYYIQLETEVTKLREIIRKNSDPKLVEKVDELEKEIKKHTADAKVFFEDKIGKPINDKYKDDVKKISESVLKSTKEVEVSLTILSTHKIKNFLFFFRNLCRYYFIDVKLSSIFFNNTICVSRIYVSNVQVNDKYLLINTYSL